LNANNLLVKPIMLTRAIFQAIIFFEFLWRKHLLEHINTCYFSIHSLSFLVNSCCNFLKLLSFSLFSIFLWMPFILFLLYGVTLVELANHDHKLWLKKEFNYYNFVQFVLLKHGIFILFVAHCSTALNGAWHRLY